MIIYIDNVLLQTKLHKVDTLEKIIKSIEKLVMNNGRVVTEILVDGKKILFDYDAKAHNIREQIRYLEFYTSAPEVVLLENIQHLNEHLDQGKASFERALYFFKEGLPKRAFKIILAELDRIEMIVDTLEAVSALSKTIQKSPDFHHMVHEFNQAIERLLYFLQLEEMENLVYTIQVDLLSVATLIYEQIDCMYYSVLDDFLDEKRGQ
ncbi:MAG: hypothetical protein NTX05_08155 [Fusobacteria bacterium]|nr:hypothetical protein [Fusobacteriota bacterium]